MSEANAKREAGVGGQDGRPLKILFISHDGYRAGAQLYLLKAVRWLVANRNVEATVLLLAGGELEGEFAGICRTLVLASPPSRLSRLRSDISRIFRGAAEKTERIAAHDIPGLLGAIAPDVVYANTLVSGAFLAGVDGFRGRAFVHVHELESWIDRYPGFHRAARLNQSETVYGVVSERVGEVMVERFGLSPANVVVAPGFVSSLPNLAEADGMRKAGRDLLGIPQEAFVVGGCGTQDLRKGLDIFIGTAERLACQSEPATIRFAWLGGTRDQDFGYWSRVDLAKGAAAANMSLLDAMADPAPFFAAIDVLFISSREDPFPLIGLEAASWAKPLIAMEKTGGMEGFIGDVAGIVVPYKDCDAVAAAIKQLARSPDLCRQFGQAARKRVESDYFVDGRMEALHRTLVGMVG